MAVIGFVSGRVSFCRCSDAGPRILPPVPKCSLCSNPIGLEYKKYGKCWYCNKGDPIDGHNVQHVVAGSIYVPEWTDDVQHKEIQSMKKDGRYSCQYAELICEVLRQDYPPLGVAEMRGYLVPAPARWASNNTAPQTLARALSEISKLEVIDALKYVRATESEKSLSGREERKANVANSMKSAYDFHDNDVYVVDDVMTTGYSICEGARALRVGGCTGEIWGLVAARNVRESELINLGIVVTDNE